MPTPLLARQAEVQLTEADPHHTVTPHQSSSTAKGQL